MLEQIISGLIGGLIGAIIVAFMWYGDIRAFQQDAVMYDYGHWTVHSEFDWVDPLTKELEGM